MNIDRFLQLLESPSKSQADLVTMRANALERNAVQHMRLAERVLDHRFPGWRRVRTRRGGRKPTDVMFMGEKKHFISEKEAYIWLMERFTQHYPKPFEQMDWQTAFVAKGARTLYFAKSLKSLFRTSPELAADSNKFHRLTNGWYAKLVLSESQKIELLRKFASVAGLKMGRDWDWDSRSADPESIDPDELLRELQIAE